MTQFPQNFGGRPFLRAAGVFLCVYAAALPLSISVNEGAILAAALCYAIAWRRGETIAREDFARLRAEYLPQAWLFYALAAVLASALAAYPARSFHYLVPDLLKPFICLVIFAALRKEFVRPALVSFIMGAAAAALIGVYGSLSCYVTQGVFTRAQFSGSYTFFGEVAVFALCAIAELRNQSGQAEPGRWQWLALPLALAVAASQTRSAILALALAITVLFVFEKRLRRRMAVFAFLSAAALAGVTALVPALSGRLAVIPKSAAHMAGASGVRTDSSMNNRFQQWQAGRKIFADHPLTGVGPNNFTILFDFYHPGTIDNRHGWSAHNLYIQQAAERGVIGLAALLCLMATLIRLAWHTRSAAALAACCALLAMSLTGETLQETREAGCFFLLLAAAYANARVDGESGGF